MIPHVISVDQSKRESKTKKYKFPEKCPSCGSKVEKEFNKQTKKYDVVKRCSSKGFSCEKIAIEKIKHFVSKDALNIDGLGKKVVEKFMEHSFIRYPQDIFKLNFNKIENLSIFLMRSNFIFSSFCISARTSKSVKLLRASDMMDNF